MVHISANPPSSSANAPPAAPPGPTAKKPRVSRVTAAIIVVVVLVVAGVGGYFLYKELTPSSSSNTITVGMPLPLDSLIGQNILQSAQLAVNQINAAGGVDVNGTSYQYKIVTYDTEEADPSIPIANGVQGVTTLITQDHVNFLIGGYRSDVVLAELPIAAEYKTLYITFGADTGVESFVGTNYATSGKYIFDGFTNTTAQGDQYNSLLLFLLTGYKEGVFPTNITNIAVLGEQAAWTQADIGTGGTGSPLWPILKSVGFNPVYIEYFPTQPTGGSYDSLLTTLANDNTQAIYILAAGTETPLLISNYGDFNWAADTATNHQKPLLLGADVMAEFNGTTSTNNYFKMTGGACADEMTFGWGPTLSGISFTPSSVPFYNDFVQNYSVNPSFADGFVYSAFFYLAQAIEKAKSLSTDAVIPFLQATDFTGPMGTVRFSSTHGLNVSLYPYPSDPAFGMQWHQNGMLYPIWSSLWTKPNFPAAATFTAGSTVWFKNYEYVNSTGAAQTVGNFTVIL